MTDLTKLSSECTDSLGINSRGQVVGYSCGEGDALLWENGQEIDLNIFNHPDSGLQQLVLAYNINDSGEIDGLGVPPGVDPGDVFTLGHVFVLIPCDDKHDDGEGCEDGRATDVTQSIPAQVSQNPATTMSPATLPGDRINAIRARPAHGYPYRSFGTYQSK